MKILSKNINEILLDLMKSGIIDYIILEILYIVMMRKDTFFDIIGREFLKIIFIMYLIYEEIFIQFKSIKKYKSSYEYMKYIFINFIFFFNRSQLDENTKIILDTLDFFFFIVLYYLFRKDLKSYI